MSATLNHPKDLTDASMDGCVVNSPMMTFDPRGIATALKVWVRSDMGVGMNGATVSSWSDLSGEGNGLTQSTASSQPSLSEMGLGGLPELVFDGSADVLNGASLFGMMSAANSWTIAVVCRGWTWGSSTAHNSGRAVLGAPSGGGGYLNQTVLSQAGGGPSGGFYNGSSHKTAKAKEAGSEGADLVWLMTNSSGNLTIRVNGVAGTTVSSAGSLQSAATTLGIGHGTGSGTTTSFWDGSISEVLVFDGALSSSDQANLESYLGDRYNVSIASSSAAPSGDDDFVAKCKDSSDLYGLWTCQDQSTGDLADGATVMTDQSGNSRPDISAHVGSTGNWQVEDSSPPDASMDSLSKYVSTDASDLDSSNFASIDSGIAPISSDTDSSSGFVVLYLPSEYLSGNSKVELVCYDGSGSSPTAASGAMMLGGYASNWPSSVKYLHSANMASDTSFNPGSGGNSGTDSWQSGAWTFFGWRLVADGSGGFTTYCYVQKLGSSWGTNQTSWNQGQTVFATLKDGLRFGYNSTSLAGSAGTAWAAHGIFSSDIGVGSSGVTLRTIFETIS